MQYIKSLWSGSSAQNPNESSQPQQQTQSSLSQDEIRARRLARLAGTTANTPTPSSLDTNVTPQAHTDPPSPNSSLSDASPQCPEPPSPSSPQSVTNRTASPSSPPTAASPIHTSPQQMEADTAINISQPSLPSSPSRIDEQNQKPVGIDSHQWEHAVIARILKTGIGKCPTTSSRSKIGNELFVWIDTIDPVSTVTGFPEQLLDSIILHWITEHTEKIFPVDFLLSSFSLACNDFRNPKSPLKVIKTVYK